MDDHLLAFLQTSGHLRTQAGLPSDLDVAPLRPAAVQNENGPAGLGAEESAGRDEEHLISLPQDESGQHTVAGAESRPRTGLREKGPQHGHAFLFDAQGGDARVAARIDPSDGGVQRALPTPLIDQDSGPRCYADGILREYVHLDLEVVDVSDLHERLARLHEAGTLAMDRYDLSGNR